jgi:hypothetical protein
MIYDVLPSDVVKILESVDKMGADAGQNLGTLGDSTSGCLVIDYLQKGYACGLMLFERRIAVDSESPTVQSVAGSCGEILDKLVAISARGGNAHKLNHHQIVTLALCSRASIYGRQDIATYDEMIAPGGLNNRTCVGFHVPNERDFMVARSDIFVEPGTKMRKRPQLPKAVTLGNRLLNLSGNVPGAPTEVVISMGSGENDKFRQNTLDTIKKTESKLLDRGRGELSSRLSHDFSERRRGDEALDRLAYSSHIRNSAALSVGNNVMNNRVFIDKFREQSLIKAKRINPKSVEGNINVRPTVEEEDMVSVPMNIPRRVGDFMIRFKFDSSYTIGLPTRPYRNGDIMGKFEIRILVEGHEVVYHQEPKPHPFLNQPIPWSHFLAFTGVHASSRSEASFKSQASAFSTNDHGVPFRNDLTSEEVMNCYANMNPSLWHDLGRFIGFNPVQSDRLARLAPFIGQIRDLEDGADYASIPAITKSASTHGLEELLLTSCGPSFALLGGEQGENIKRMVVTHALSMLLSDFNLCFTVPPRTAGERRVVEIPLVEITPIL